MSTSKKVAKPAQELTNQRLHAFLQKRSFNFLAPPPSTVQKARPRGLLRGSK